MTKWPYTEVSTVT